MGNKLYILLLSFFMLSGCTKAESHYINDQGLFLLSKANEEVTVETQESTEEGDLIIDFYFETDSGASMMVFDRLRSDVKEYIVEENAKVRVHPLVYLNNHSAMGSSYTRAKAILSVAKYEPDYLLEFFNEVVIQDYVNDKNVEEILSSLDMSQNSINKIVRKQNEFHDILIEKSQNYLDQNLGLIKLNYQGKESTFEVKDINTVAEDLHKSIESLKQGAQDA
ncbi:MAG: hypothetical protein GXY87_00470 [Tissierellia bacterium]|nr:hypothetical protein [Tissierellia bacterium]